MTFFHFDNILITLSNITCHHLWCSSSFLSHIIAYLALSLLHLEWWFFFPCITAWRATISYPLCHPMRSNPKISIREVVLSMMIHVTLVYESLYLSGYVFLLEMVLYWLKHAQRKKKEKRNSTLFVCLLYCPPLSTCIDVEICFTWFICWKDFVWELCEILISYWGLSHDTHIFSENVSRPFGFHEKGKWPFLMIFGFLPYSSLHPFFMWLLSMLWYR